MDCGKSSVKNSKTVFKSSDSGFDLNKLNLKVAHSGIYVVVH